MIREIKRKLNNPTIKKLGTNFSYMAIIQIASKILPFITIPYIVATIGVEKFGLITFAYAIMAYFQMVVDYSFNVIGAKDVSINREERDAYSKIFWTIMIAKILMLILSLVIFFIVLYSFSSLNDEKMVYIFSLGLIFGQVLFPIWFFQGMEEMKYIAIFSIISKIFYTLAIFIFIRDADDYILVPLLNSISIVVLGIVSLYFILIKFNIKFILPDYKDLVYYFKEGWYLFLSFITNNLYTTTNTVLLGSLTNYSVVGIYTLAATVVGAFLQIIGQFNQVIYPHLARYSLDVEKLKKETRKFLKFYTIVLIIMSIFLGVSSKMIIEILFGQGHSDSILILQILSIILTLQSLGGFFTRYMIIRSKQKKVLKITFLTMIFNLIIIVPFIIFFQGLGVALSKVIVESFQVFLNIRNNQEIVKNLFKRTRDDL